MHELENVQHTEVPLWLNASDVVLLTSIQEGSPNIIKEALACNVPVVSVNVGDVAERIQDIEGCYVTLPKYTDIADKLCLVHAGIRRVDGRNKMHEFSVEAVAKRLKVLYDACLSEEPTHLGDRAIV
jgi:glycosyltransferase involved in cell wall biosynthesis